MTNYEELISAYDELEITEHNMKCKGLYCDKTIWINSELNTAEKACILAEEIGHYETSVGDILDQSQISNMKQEHTARVWAYNKLITIEELKCAFNAGHKTTYEMADFLDVDETL